MTGGLDHILGPDADDASRFAYPGRREERFPLHGRAHAEPARLAGYGREGGMLWPRGSSRRRRSMANTWSGGGGSSATRVARRSASPDRVVNLGPAPNPVMALYHVNLGWPLIGEGRAHPCARHPARDDGV